MSDSTYREAAYTAWRDPSKRSAQAVVPHVLEMLRPASVIDVGCGLGMWAGTFKELGVESVHGIDGHDVPTEELLIPVDDFTAVDLTQELRLERTYDLVVCLEVAEHLAEAAARAFVRTLTSLGPVVLFSAAVPYQRGANHVNEQWPAYWAALFAEHDYRVVDCLRPRIWNNEQVEPYYRQNMMFYVREGRLQEHPSLARAALPAGELPLALVHPHYYLKRSAFQDTSLNWWALKLSVRVRALMRRLGLARR